MEIDWRLVSEVALLEAVMASAAGAAFCLYRAFPLSGPSRPIWGGGGAVLGLAGMACLLLLMRGPA